MHVEVITYTEGEDPRDAVLKRFAPVLSQIPVYGNRVLVAQAPHRERSAGGVIYSSRTKDEHKYQGKVVLCMKLGPNCCRSDGQYSWRGPTFKPGDWLVVKAPNLFRCGLSPQLTTLGHPCALVFDDLIECGVPDPEMFW
jgi:co-chaperonin GroES (HSP10)